MEYENIPHHWVNRLSFLIRKELSERFLASGFRVSAEEWAVLLTLWQRDGRTTGELAQLTIRDRTTMTRLIDGMVSKELVERRAGQADRRQSFVFLSAGGAALEDQLVPIASDMIADSLEGISDRQATQALKVLRRMTENLMGLKTGNGQS